MEASTEVEAEEGAEQEKVSIVKIGETCEIDAEAQTDNCFDDYFCEPNTMTCWAHACKYHEDCHDDSSL